MMLSLWAQRPMCKSEKSPEYSEEQMPWKVVSEGNLSGTSAWEIWTYLARKLLQLPHGLWWRSPLACFQEGAQLRVLHVSRSNQRNIWEKQEALAHLLLDPWASLQTCCQFMTLVMTGGWWEQVSVKHWGMQPTCFTLGTEHLGSNVSLSFPGSAVYILHTYIYIHTYI